MKKLIILLFFFGTTAQAQEILSTYLDSSVLENPPPYLHNSKFELIDRDRLKGLFVTGVIGELKNGKREGEFLYFKKGKLYAYENYKNGILEGYYNDTIKSGNYKNGKKEGLWKFKDESKGNVEQITYREDVKDGPYTILEHSNKIIGNYKQDKKQGKWYHYTDDRLLSIKKYKNDVLINKTVKPNKKGKG